MKCWQREAKHQLLPYPIACTVKNTTTYASSCVVSPAVLLIFSGRGRAPGERLVPVDLGQKGSSKYGNSVWVWRTSHVHQPCGCTKIVAVLRSWRTLSRFIVAMRRYVTEPSIWVSLNLELLRRSVN